MFTGQMKRVRGRWRESGSWEGRGWRAEEKGGRKVYFLKRSLWCGRTGLFKDWENEERTIKERRKERETLRGRVRGRNKGK